MEAKLAEHCPGPPTSQTSSPNETMDIDLGQKLRQKDEELQQLKDEIQSYAGKLKGYQTLGDLYAESQKQCSGYRRQNDELARQLNGLMRRISPTQHHDHSAAQPAAGENETETAGKRGADDAEKSSWLLDFAEEGERRRRDSDRSLSSPSFVNINSSSSDDSSRVDTRNATAALTQTQDKMSDAAATADSTNLSIDVEQLTAELKHAGHRHEAATASYQDVTSNLIRTSLSVLRLERQTRVQKSLMEQMTMKLTELNDQLTVKNKTIAQLQEDRARVEADMKILRTARDKVMLDSRTADTDRQQETTEETDKQTEQVSGDWLEVEKRVSSAGCVDIAAVSTTEMELKRRVDKLSSMITELVGVNRSWDEHCKQLEVSHSQQMAALNAELSDVRRRLDDRQKCDDERQREFDELLLSAKKQREDEEMAKEDALSQLHAERRLRLSAEDRCVEFSRKMAELEAQLRALQTAGQMNLAQLSQSAQQSSSVTSSMTSSPATDRDMMLELQMLREQVTVFKEDFDQERHDREASRATMEHLDTKLRDTSLELATTKKKLMDTLANLRTAKTENLQLKDRFQKVVDDLQTLQRHATTRPVPPPPSRPYVPPVYAPQPQHIYGATGGPVWSCGTCTFENPAQRTSCEMCGRMKDAQQVLYRRDADVSPHHHVAGLHDYQGAMPSPHSDWSRLPRSNLETDQSPHRQF